MRGYVAGFVTVAVLALVVGAVAADVPQRLTGSDRGHTTGEPGTGSGWDREQAALMDGLESGDTESSFREHAARGIYGMQSAARDRAVDRVVQRVRRQIQARHLRTVEAVSRALNAGLEALSDGGYGDVYDTVVLEHIDFALAPALRHAGMDPDELDLG